MMKSSTLYFLLFVLLFSCFSDVEAQRRYRKGKFNLEKDHLYVDLVFDQSFKGGGVFSLKPGIRVSNLFGFGLNYQRFNRAACLYSNNYIGFNIRGTTEAHKGRGYYYGAGWTVSARQFGGLAQNFEASIGRHIYPNFVLGLGYNILNYDNQIDDLHYETLWNHQVFVRTAVVFGGIKKLRKRKQKEYLQFIDNLYFDFATSVGIEHTQRSLFYGSFGARFSGGYQLNHQLGVGVVRNQNYLPQNKDNSLNKFSGIGLEVRYYPEKWIYRAAIGKVNYWEGYFREIDRDFTNSGRFFIKDVDFESMNNFKPYFTISGARTFLRVINVGAELRLFPKMDGVLYSNFEGTVVENYSAHRSLHLFVGVNLLE